MARILLWLGMQRTGLMLAVILVAGCGDSAQLTLPETSGVEPEIPEPDPSLLPIINVAPARGWPDGATPSADDVGDTVWRLTAAGS